MKTKLLVALIMVTSLPVVAEARIGETRAQLIMRNGKPVIDDADATTWNLGTLVFTAFWDANGVSVVEALGPGESGALPEGEKQKFLAAQLPAGAKWIPVTEVGAVVFGGTTFTADPLVRSFSISSDKKRLSRFTKPDQNLYVYSPEGAALLLKRQKTKDESAAVKF